MAHFDETDGLQTTNGLTSICVATFRRPEGLRLLLESLDGLTAVPGRDIEVIVADNDPPNARSIALRTVQGSPVRYIAVPERNLAIARNAGVAAAVGDFVAFVDDDESPDPDWLVQLHRAIDSFGADAAFGRVCAKFEEGTDPAIAASELFNRPVGRLGSSPETVHTSNTIVRAEALLSLGAEPFSPRLGRLGGSDSHAFERLRRLGFRLVEAPDAVVREDVPRERATVEWMKRRSFAKGNGWARREVELSEAPRRLSLRLALGAIARLAASGALSIIHRNPARRLHWRLLAHSNAGKVSGLMGRTVQRY